jgi:hypothetical protein
MNAQAATMVQVKTPRESRKSARVKLQLEAKIKDKLYPLIDCSTDGIGVAGVIPNVSIGETANVQIYAATSEGKIRIDLTANQIWLDHKKKRSGWQFIGITAQQTNMIDELTLLFAGGKLKSTPSLELALVTNSKTQKIEKNVEADVSKSGSIGNTVRRIIGLCIFAVLGILAALFLGKLIYSKLFLIEATSASIFSPVINITSPVEGTMGALLAEGKVTENQVIAKITQSSGTVTELSSTCNCEVISTSLSNGSFVGAGQVVSVLVPSDAKPTVSVRLPFQDLERVVHGAKVDLLYLDGQSVKGAKIIGLPKITEETSTIVTLYVEAGRDLKPSQVGEPVYAQVNTSPW